MRTTLLGLSLLAMAGGCSAAEVSTIDDFNYPDVAALRAAWVDANGSRPAEIMPHDDGMALKLPCPFTDPGLERGSFDRQVKLDLSRARSVTFDLYCDDPTVVKSGTLFFRSGQAWYHGWFIPTKGWKHVVLDKSTFFPQENVGGWDTVDAIRISIWPLDTHAADTFCALDNLQARWDDVVVISGSMKGVRGTGGAKWAETMLRGLLAKVGVAHDVIGETDLESGALHGQKLAIFPFSPELSDKAVEQIRGFVAGGGKVMFAFAVPDAVADLLGLANRSFAQRMKRDDFAEIAFTPDALPGLPSSMVQNSMSKMSFAAGPTHNARVIGSWRDKKGQDQGPAVLVSDNGAFMGQILADAEPMASKLAFVRALVGHFVPEAWEAVVSGNLAKARNIRPFRTPAEFDAFVATAQNDPAFAAKVRAALVQATVAEATARRLLADKRYPEAQAAAERFHDALAEAYFVAHKSRTVEFRAVWNASGTGDCGTWDMAMRRLKAAGFNTVVPNMLGGGFAHYDSKLLPHSDDFKEKGDQIAQCVAAGKKYGVEVHVWKVCWNVMYLPDGPESFVGRMRAEHRLQANAKGEEVLYLCPSHPKNFELERDALLEVLRNYDVDGLQFDYIRYPDEESCYCDGCRERFEAAHGATVAKWPEDCYSGPLKAEYRQFRCDQITRLVKAVSEDAHRLKPWIKLSAAAIGDYPACRDRLGQDWVLWCKQGYLDFVCPMDYEVNDETFQAVVRGQLSLLGGTVPLYPGIGSFINPDEAVVGQMEMGRNLGADGFALFNMGSDLAMQGLPKFTEGITSRPASIPQNGPQLRFEDVAGGGVRVTVVGPGQHRQAVKSFSGRLQLQDMGGRKLADLGELPAPGESATVKLTATANGGGQRVAAAGAMVFVDGTSQAFMVRSRGYLSAGRGQQ